MAAGRCLSDLPDDLLRHILSFAPAKEAAAAAAVISQRWRSLWRASGAVNIDSRSYGRRLDASTRDGFFRGAEAALAAACVPVRRFTLHADLEAEDHRDMQTFQSRYISPEQELRDMIGAMLSKLAARRVEELRIGAQKFGRASTNVLSTGWGFCELRLGAHPSKDLRVLHIANCINFTPAPPGTSFPRLAEMRLLGCAVSYEELQGMIDTAPLLATLQLESVFLFSDEGEIAQKDPRATVVQCYRLCCPAVTALVLENCQCPSSVRDGIELDMPRLRYLRFKGYVHLERLSLKSHAPYLDRVDLHFIDHVYIGDEDNKVRIPFWQFLRNFNNAKVLKLKLDYPIGCIAVVEKELDALLGDKLFSNLHRLEVEGTYEPSSKAPGFAMANLLHYCLVVCDLRLKLMSRVSRPRLSPSDLRHFAKMKAQSDFDGSVDHFKNRRISLHEDGDDNYDVSDIPGLSEHSFNCVHKHIRRVSLQSRMEEPNCFLAQLAKFFTEWF